MRILTIGKNDSGQRVDKFISKSLPNLPTSLIYKYIRTKKIKRNGRRCAIGEKLEEGDEIKLFIPEEFFEKDSDRLFMHISPRIEIIYEDEDVLLVNKRAGMIVHSDENEQADTLINHIKAYLFRKGEYDPENENSFSPALCNRIDRNTCGIVICAKTAPALREMNERIKDRSVRKKYIAVCHGIFKKNEDVMTAWLIKNADDNLVKIYDSDPPKGAKKIVTAYRVIATTEKLSLLEVSLITGRTHQIRAHLAHCGHPLLGDGKYGINRIDRDMGYCHQALASHAVTFDLKSDGALKGVAGKTFSTDAREIGFVKELFPNISF